MGWASAHHVLWLSPQISDAGETLENRIYTPTFVRPRYIRAHPLSNLQDNFRRGQPAEVIMKAAKGYSLSDSCSV